MKYEQLLLRYLKEKNIYTIFKENALDDMTKEWPPHIHVLFRKKDSRKMYIKDIDVKWVIDDSFLWKHTPQGRNFWEEINNDWQSFIEFLEYHHD